MSEAGRDGPADGEPLLQVRDLQVRFTGGGRRVHAVNGLTYQLRAGRTLAIIGESGSGKTVSSRALMGLLPPTATVTGSARIDGMELVGHARGRDAPPPGRGHRDGVPGPDPLAEPDHADRHPDHRGHPRPRPGRARGGQAARARAAVAGPDRRPATALPRVPAPALRRHAAAGDDRDRARRRTRRCSSPTRPPPRWT